MNAQALAQELRRDRDALVRELEAAGASFRGNECRCPFHDDKTASAGVYEGADGAWRFKCLSAGCGVGGDVFDVQAKARGLQLKDVLPRETVSRGASGGNGATHGPTPAPANVAPQAERSKPKAIGETLDEAIAAAVRIAGGNLEAVHHYENPATRHARYHVLRIRRPDGSKSFRPLTETREGYVLEAPPKPWPLYRRREIRDSEFVVVVEGEKACDALHVVGIAATTAPGGAGKASFADWAPLAGKTVYCWPDADPPDPKTRRRTGIEHMREVAEIVATLNPPARLFWIDCDSLGLPAKGDAWDFVAALPDDGEARQAAVMALLDQARPLGASIEVSRLVEDGIAGVRKAHLWPWRLLSHFTRALLPGTVTLICGDAGARKSLALLEAMAFWYRRGLRVALYELEEDRAFHLLRALAQADGCADITDPEWAAANPDAARAALKRHSDFLDGFGRCVWAAPQKQVSLTDLTAWVKGRVDDGARIIAVDPVTAAENEREQWAADGRFLIEVKRIIGDAGASLILVTHPRKGRGKGPAELDDLAGGAAYSRFSQTIIWIERLQQTKMAAVSNGFKSEERQINQAVRILKARNATGAGLQLGFYFDHATLRSSEEGILER